MANYQSIYHELSDQITQTNQELGGDFNQVVIFLSFLNQQVLVV